MGSKALTLLINSFPKLFLAGIKTSIPLMAISFFFAMCIAIAVALIRFAHVPVLQQICRFYVWVVRGTPLLVQMYIVFFGLTQIGVIIDPFVCAVIVMSINEGAYCSETIRGALESVPRGQIEAGYCVGLSYLQIMRRIVLPQAIRTAFPALANSVLSMTKDTSLAAGITVAEMFMASQRIVARTYEALLIYSELAVVYLIFCTVITWAQRLIEKKLRITGKSALM